jgi:hypothetical protein
MLAVVAVEIVHLMLERVALVELVAVVVVRVQIV